MYLLSHTFLGSVEVSKNGQLTSLVLFFELQLDPRRSSLTPSKSPGHLSSSPLKSPVTPALPRSSRYGGVGGGVYVTSAHQRRCEILFLLEQAVVLLMSQSLRYLLDGSVDPHDKQVLRKELAGELVGIV